VDIPAGTKGEPGVQELIGRALSDGLGAQQLLEQGLMAGMQVVGRRFADNEIFIPEVLIAARAMRAGFEALKPAFADLQASSRGVFVIGTVRGDLHDIGKSLVSIILEGSGWSVVDLGTDCPGDRFVEAVDKHPGCAVGLSAMLTTTMLNMADTVDCIRRATPEATVLVGGAPVTEAFAVDIGADGYGADPTQAAEVLDRLLPRA